MRVPPRKEHLQRKSDVSSIPVLPSPAECSALIRVLLASRGDIFDTLFALAEGPDRRLAEAAHALLQMLPTRAAVREALAAALRGASEGASLEEATALELRQRVALKGLLGEGSPPTQRTYAMQVLQSLLQPFGPAPASPEETASLQVRLPPPRATARLHSAPAPPFLSAGAPTQRSAGLITPITAVRSSAAAFSAL